MPEKKSPFQTIVFGVFAFFIIAAVFAFATFSGGKGERPIGEVLMWGSFDRNLMETYLQTLNDIDNRVENVFYEEIPADVFQSRLAEALADGSGPDLFILDQSNLVRHWDKVSKFSYEDIPEREYKDTYIEEAEMFLSSEGIRGLPFSVDSLVMYWNRDIFAQNGFSQPPSFWDEFFLLSERITKRDNSNNIEIATVAFGEFDNVTHAKDIISTLIMQAGGDIVGFNESGLYVDVTVREGANEINPTQTALRFFTEFANPVKTVYTWNRSLPSSLDSFAQGKLAIYIGYASDVKTIQAKNAHLNFDVAPLPQIRTGEQKRVMTYGKLHALAVPKVAVNSYGGEEMAKFMSGREASEVFAQINSTASPRRDLLSKTPDDPLLLIFRNAALLSRAWFDPNSEETTRIFRRMVGDVTSGATKLSDSIGRASQELNNLIK